MSNGKVYSGDRTFTLTIPGQPAGTSIYLCAQRLSSGVYSIPQTIQLLLAQSPHSPPVALFFYPRAHLTLAYTATSITLQHTPPPSVAPSSLSLTHRTTWNNLTSYITPQTLQSSGIPLGQHFTPSPDAIPIFFPLPPLPRSLSNPLQHLIHSRYSDDPAQMLADLQLSFISNLHFRSSHALYHWHSLLHHICSSQSLSFSQSVITPRLAAVLQAQFSTYPGSKLAAQPAVRKLLAAFVIREYQDPSVRALASKLDTLLGPQDTYPKTRTADLLQHAY
eukprot:GFKZ01013891.1.p1 GENE.GFKZ01013891.1~~GFKZ01013891.1.p1  ORF type:complete len:278 (-),score=21.21 GFKZ01013891.1:608-1441(-)